MRARQGVKISQPVQSCICLLYTSNLLVEGRSRPLRFLSDTPRLRLRALLHLPPHLPRIRMNLDFLTIIQGNTGEGKTYFAMRLAAACTNRKPLPGMETVSYTHLDVYKRQIYVKLCCNGCYQTTGGLWQITGKCRGRDSAR